MKYRMLPNPLLGKNGAVYMSYADFICPETCSEPENICTVTGKPRTEKLYRYIESLQYKDFRFIVVRSHQLAPGVGGYQPLSLFQAFDRIVASNNPVIVSTACFCHGVMHAFEELKKSN